MSEHRSARRGAAMLVLAAVLVTAWIVDARVERPAPEVAADVQTPMGARPAARSSAWFCTGGTAAGDGAANGSVVVANAGRRPLTGTLTVVPNEGDTRQIDLTVPGSGRTGIRLADVVAAPFASALVELDGGEAVVEMTASGERGESVTPCASNASTSWYFAEGVTTRDAREVISLFNPFPEDAVVDLVFTTEEGEVTPQALTGLSVRGRGMYAVTVGDHVQRRESVSTRISARAGRLVAARLQTFDGSNGREGLSVSLGAAAPGEVWYFPEGFVTDGLTERFQVFNPGTEEAQVELELSLEQGQAEPIQLTVPPEARVTLTANDEARIPKNVAHAVTARSTNGVPVVVERTVDGVSPSPRTGLAITSGARVPAARWIAAGGQVDETTDELVIVHNPSSRAARVTVTLLDNGVPVVPPGLDRIDVGAGQRRAVRLANVRRGPTPLLVAADQSVVVERSFHKINDIGIALAPAVPLRA